MGIEGQTDSKTGLAALGIGALAIACCLAGPLVLGALGGIAIGTVLGVTAGLLAAFLLIALVVLRSRRQRQSVSPRESGDGEP